MLDRFLRGPKRRLLSPVARVLRVSPNGVTWLGLMVGVSSAASVLLAQPGWALGLWWTNRLLDGLDGEIAHAQQKQSDLGGYYDIMADLLVYAAIPLACTLAAPTPVRWFFLALMLSSFYLNVGSWMYLSSLLEKRGWATASNHEFTSVTMPSGLIEGAETVLLFSLFLLLPQFLAALFGLTAVLVGISVVQRLLWARKHLGG